MYGRVHLYLGPTIVFGGIINGFIGFIGFIFGGEPRWNIWYGPCVGAIVLVLLGLLGWKRWTQWKKRKDGAWGGAKEIDHELERLTKD